MVCWGLPRPRHTFPKSSGSERKMPSVSEPFVIQVAGASGSGKSHAVCAFMLEAADCVEVLVNGRVSWYSCKFPKLARELAVVGPYGRVTGGCDALGDQPAAWAAVRSHMTEGRNVVFEGLMMMSLTRAGAVVEEFPGYRYFVVELTTPLADCKQGVNTRREEAGTKKMVRFNPSTFENNKRRSKSFAYKMWQKHGAARVHASRDAVLGELLRIVNS